MQGGFGKGVIGVDIEQSLQVVDGGIGLFVADVVAGADDELAAHAVIWRCRPFTAAAEEGRGEREGEQEIEKIARQLAMFPKSFKL